MSREISRTERGTRVPVEDKGQGGDEKSRGCGP